MVIIVNKRTIGANDKGEEKEEEEKKKKKKIADFAMQDIGYRGDANDNTG